MPGGNRHGRRGHAGRAKRHTTAEANVRLVDDLTAALERNAAAREGRDPAQRDDLDPARRAQLVGEIVARFARHHRRAGFEIPALVRCSAVKAERLGRADNLGAEGKVIYNSVELAQAAATALAAAGLGRTYPYPCPRSRGGHAHLTSSPPAEQPRRLTSVLDGVDGGRG